jgi:hypothetical protein
MHQGRVARGLGHLMTFGEGPDALTVDLRTIEGQRIAMQNAMGSREVLQAYWHSAREMGGTRGDQAAMAFEHVFLGGAVGPTEALRLRQRFERGGGLAGALREGNVPAELATEAARRRTIEQRPEFRVTEQVEAAMQAPLERLGRPLVEGAAELRLALAAATTSLQDLARGALVKAVQDLPAQLLEVLRQFGTQLQALPGLGASLWPGLGGGGALGLLPAPEGRPQGPALLPPGTYPLLTPTRPGP